NLTINKNDTATIDTVACESYVFAGNTLTASGQYFDTLQTSTNCDSLVVLNLTINNRTESADTVTACTDYRWELNDSTYMASTTDTVIISGALGCDSLVVLHLTINQPSELVWVEGNTSQQVCAGMA